MPGDRIVAGRDYAEFLRRMGVKERTALDLHGTATPVIVIDDTTQATRPLPFASRGAGATAPAAGAGTWSGAQIQCLAPGGLFLDFSLGAVAWTLIRASASILTTVSFQLAGVDFGSEPSSTITIDVGFRNLNPGTFGGPLLAANQPLPTTVYLSYGQWVAMMATTANTAIATSLIWREIP